MQVLQIIPAAFGYFETIGTKAFTLAEELQAVGIDVLPFTLQAGAPSRAAKRVAKESGKRGGFSPDGTVTLLSLEQALLQADIIQVHTPFLGFGRELLRFKKKYPAKPLIVVHHGSLPYQDLFSLFIAGYTAWYLPKILRMSAGLMLPSEDDSKSLSLQRYFGKNVILTNVESRVQLLKYQKSTSFLEKYFALLLQHVYL